LNVFDRTIPLMTTAALLFACSGLRANDAIPAHLPGELPADEVLNGVYPFPPSPAIEVTYDESGLAKDRLGKVPAPGVHPRILFGPDDLPELRQRLSSTNAGKAMLATLRERTGGTILKAGTWEAEAYDKLASGDADGALKLIGEKRKPSYPQGHYQPHVLYAIVMESFDALVADDAARSRKAATAIATWARMVEPLLEGSLREPLYDDVWRAKISGPQTGSWSDSQGIRDLFGGHLLGYAYDFTASAMTDAERDQTRRVIARATAGRVWMGARLPHHFRNWNWIAVGLQQPLLALSIEGEEGYDPRVYKLGVDIARDYLTYGISPRGSSTEAVGYTQFGFVWGNPFFVAASRRGDMLLAHPHLRAMPDWYLASLEPFGGLWTSHGDGGAGDQNGRPAVWTLQMFRRFYPNDARVELLWQNYVKNTRSKPFADRYHIIEPLVWCADEPTIDHGDGAALKLPTTFFDADRGSLNVRSSWSSDAALVQFECRPDGHGASHEHADRGNFTFSALGRQWSRESFRSIETRHHSNVLIDGLGQGYWPGPGVWLGHVETDWAIAAACDAKAAYDWWWPKSILADADDSARFQFPRWATYREEAAQFRKNYAGVPIEHDDRPAVVAFWKGFDDIAGGPRLWDEDGWPVRLPHNPVQRAFRTIAFVKSPAPYLVVVDDIQRDDQPRLFEWLMQTGPDTDVVSLKDDEIVLCDASVPRAADGTAKPAKGDRTLVVRTVGRSLARGAREFQATPSIRLETFEKKDTNSREGRSFGVDKRLVIPSRAVSPDFKVVLIPQRAGDAPAVTKWDDAGTTLTITIAGQTDTWTFAKGDDGRTRITGKRGDSIIDPIEAQH
jgi:hypothetical protein